MLWPWFILCAVAALAALHLCWRARFRRAQEAAQAELDKLTRAQQQGALQIQTQQEALFNSMVEGMLLLDEAGRIVLANRAFSQLFGVTGDLRSRTIIEALRIHELADLVEFLGTQKQVLGYELKLTGFN